MAKRTWFVPLDGKNHEVEAQHGYFSGRRLVLVDGAVALDVKSNFVDVGSEHPFQLGTHPAILRVQPGLLAARLDLFVDGVNVESGVKFEPFFGGSRVFGSNAKPRSQWFWVPFAVGIFLMNVAFQGLTGWKRIGVAALGGALMGASMGWFGYKAARSKGKKEK